MNIKPEQFVGWQDVPVNYTGVVSLLILGEIRYLKNGLLHRIDGPAQIFTRKQAQGFKFCHAYWLNGNVVSEQIYYRMPSVIQNKIKRIVEETLTVTE